MDAACLLRTLCIYIATRMTYFCKWGGRRQVAGWQLVTNNRSPRFDGVSNVANFQLPAPSALTA
jgi:hypothetical protein